MSFDNEMFEKLFRRISSPQTAERFKSLRKVTTEDLSKAFQQGSINITVKSANQKNWLTLHQTKVE